MQCYYMSNVPDYVPQMDQLAKPKAPDRSWQKVDEKLGHSEVVL
jgi:hypothetical protein